MILALLTPDAGTGGVLSVTDRVADAGSSHEVGDPFPHLRSVAVHRPVPAVRDLGDLDAALDQRRQVGQRPVLLAVHEHPRARQREEPLHELAVVGDVDHRLQDRPYRLGTDLVGQARGVEPAPLA
jgi:hypothetical protein